MSDVEEESVPEKVCKKGDSSLEKGAKKDELKAGSPSAKDAETDDASISVDRINEERGTKSQEAESDSIENDGQSNAGSEAEEDNKSADDSREPMEVENVSPCPSPGDCISDSAAKDSPAEGNPMEVDEEVAKSEGEETGEKEQDATDEEEEDDEVVEKSPADSSEKVKAAAASADEAEDDAQDEIGEQSEKDASESEDEKNKVSVKESGEEDEASSASADKESDAAVSDIQPKETVGNEEEDESKDDEKEDKANDNEETENLDRPKDDDESDSKVEEAEDEDLEAASPIIVRVISTEGDEEEDDASGNIAISEVKSILESKDNSEGSENEESQASQEDSKKGSEKDEDVEGDKTEETSAESIKEKQTPKQTKKSNERRKTNDGVQKMDVQEEAAKEDGDEDAMPILAILDVRTVTEEDSPLPSKKDAEDSEKESGMEKTKEEKDSDVSDEDSQVKGAKEVSDKSDTSEKHSGIEAIANKLTKKSKQTTDETEMKNYAADTMNELLGLFGYEKVDETVKDAIQLSNNLAGPSTDNVKKGEEDKSKEGNDNAASVDDKKSVPETGDEDKEKKVADEKNTEKSAEKSSVKTTSKGPQKRECSFCNKTKPCKYQVLMLGTTKFLCDDNCFREFRTKQHIVTAPAIRDIIAQNRPITRSLMHPKDHCNVCHKEIKNGMGLLPGVGENKPLCSEECMKNYQATQGLKRACAQCGNHIQSRSKCLTWEAMEFCNEECLGKYQSYLGSHCAYCNNAVQQTSLGKYCVRFGSDIKQFCSNGCLEEFKKGLKVCSYCQKDISSGTEGFLAPVGDKGQFKEFCSQSCMEKYETMGSVTPSQPSIEPCSVCNKVTSVKVEVTFENKIHKLCSEPCIAAFRYANKINTSICDTCHKFFDLDVTCQLTIQFEGTSKRFCTKACMNVFVLYHRKVVPCSWCKVKKYNFDMIERVDSNNHVQLFCSLNCLSLFRVSLNATSSKRIQCDFCHQVKPAQYHLTMSDASIRNFCSYNCVMQFQGQFTNVAPVVAPSPTPQPVTTRTVTVATTTTGTPSGTPIISSVVSLAPSQPTPQPQPQITKAISIRPTAPPVVTKIHKVMGTQTMSPTITQQVIIKQAPVKPQKNKMLMCRPMTQTKGVSCKPHPCHKSSQTDGEYREHPVFIPIPVPIFIPVPMRMYSTPVPFPVAFPLPIPVPIFIPTTKDSAQGIFKQIKEIQQKIPNNPFEADLILMAEMVAEDSAAAKTKTKALMGKMGAKGLDGEQSSSNDASSEKQEGFVVETSMPDTCQPASTFGDEVLQMALRMASSMEQPGDLENVLSNQSPDLNSTGEENGSYVSARELRGQARNNKRSSSRARGRGRKRARLEDALDREPDSPSPVAPPPHTPPVATQFDFRPIGAPQLESNCVLKFSYGVNAWKHWVLQKNTQLEKASQTNRKLKLFKTDILQLSADELNYSLCLFIKEVRKPNGDEYAPDSIYYLCLGIQQYLFENGRIDNIFSDAYYEKFTECLNEVLQRYEATLTTDGCFLTRIEEEILWECKQLGAHSPHVLLNTLMYFNTKFFMLKSIDDHLQLSFSHILKHWKKTPGSTAKGSPGGRNVLLRYYPPSQVKDSPRRRKEAIPSYEQVENLDNPLRCPVKLYEFYLSKCPESIKNRNDIFYLYPERSCVPDSPVWYSTMSLGKETIAKMLQRIRMVREVGDNITTT